MCDDQPHEEEVGDVARLCWNVYTTIAQRHPKLSDLLSNSARAANVWLEALQIDEQTIEPEVDEIIQQFVPPDEQRQRRLVKKGTRNVIRQSVAASLLSAMGIEPRELYLNIGDACLKDQTLEQQEIWYKTADGRRLGRVFFELNEALLCCGDYTPSEIAIILDVQNKTCEVFNWICTTGAKVGKKYANILWATLFSILAELHKMRDDKGCLLIPAFSAFVSAKLSRIASIFVEAERELKQLQESEEP